MRARRFCRYVLIFFVPRKRFCIITTSALESQQLSFLPSKKTISLQLNPERIPKESRTLPLLHYDKNDTKRLAGIKLCKPFLLLYLWFQFVGRIFCKHIHRRSSLFIEIRDDRWLNPYAWVELAAVHVLYDALA